MDSRGPQEKDHHFYRVAYGVSWRIAKLQITYSRHANSMHLMGRVCQQEGWKSCHVSSRARTDLPLSVHKWCSLTSQTQYNGKMSHKSRDRALNEFQDEKSNLQVMVASLKCGGTGLNLTAASKVICVDLWFSTSSTPSLSLFNAFCRQSLLYER